MSLPTPAKVDCDHTRRLPVELIQKVLSYLDCGSVSNFSKTSNTSRATALKFLFETVCINISIYGGRSTVSLAQDLRGWNSLLSKYDAFGLVRYLKLNDGVHPEIPNPHRVPRLRSNPYNREAFQDPGELATWTETWFDRAEPSLHWDTYANQWEPLAQLVSLFSNLKRLQYGFSGVMAHRLVQSLRQIRPSRPMVCWDQDILHLRHVDLSDPLVVEGAIYPLLTSFKLKFDNSALHGGWDQAKVDKLNSVLLNSPRLEKVQLWWNVLLDPNDAPFTHKFVQLPEEYEGYPRLSLTEFHIRQDSGLWETSLQYWSNRTDFTQLKVLKLEGPCVVDALTWFVDNFEDGLPQLQALTLNTWNTVHVHGQYHVSLTQFFRRLKGLSRLRLKGEISAACIRAALNYHGKTLRQLWVENNENSGRFVFSQSLIKKLRKKCKILEDLAIPLKRSKGDPEEARILWDLGTISTLTKIDLSLDISKTCDGRRFTSQRNDPPYNGFYQQLLQARDHAFRPVSIPYGRLRDLFWNSAIDLDLALQIFNIISSGKKPGAIPIETVVVRPNGSSKMASMVPNSNLNAILQELGQTWLLKRDLRDTNREDLYMVRMLEDVPFDHNWFDPFRTNVDSRLRDVFRSLWPAGRYGSGGGVRFWVNQWRSFAIDTSGLPLEPMTRKVSAYQRHRLG